MTKPVARATLRAAIGSPCPYCGEPMGELEKRPSRDHAEKPRARGGKLSSEGNRVICCEPCNCDKANRSLREFLLHLEARGDPRATHVAVFIAARCETS